ncbi:MAG: aldo/keto reductase [Dermatophilaceae bacterium]
MGRSSTSSSSGRALGSVREQIVIATKFGFDIDPDGQQHGLSSRPEHIKQVADASQRRLGVDTIDLFYQHRVDPGVPIDEVAGAVVRPQRGMCVHSGGCRSASGGHLRYAIAPVLWPEAAITSETEPWRHRDHFSGSKPAMG